MSHSCVGQFGQPVTMAQPIYQVPVVPVHLREEESLLQMLDSLGYLDNVVNDIFSKVTAAV
jgi:hypothetical protein